MIAVALLTLPSGAQETPLQAGLRLIEAGRAADAAATLEQAVKQEPRNAAAWKALGVAYAAQSDYEMAELPFGRACELAPSLDDACYFHARALYALNRFEASLERLSKAARIDRRPARIHQGRAQALDGLGRAAEAEAEFRRAIRLNGAAAPPDRIAPPLDPRLSFAAFLQRQGRAEEAIAPLEQLLREHPGIAQAHLDLGRIELQRDRLDEAARHLERAVALDSGSRAAHLLLGRVYLRLGRAAEAEPHLSAGTEPW